MPPRLVITRPQAQAQPWVQALRSRGVEACALPLIEIRTVTDPAPLRAAWRQLDRHDVVMFVSANAVAHFFAARPAEADALGSETRLPAMPGALWSSAPMPAPAAAAPWPAGVQAACTGAGTAAALRAVGVPEEALVVPAPGEAQESESLWAMLQGQSWHGRRVLVVRGDGGREWLAAQWRRAGAEVLFLTAYERHLPQLDAAGRALLDDIVLRPARSIWHFSSAEAVAHLQRLAPAARWSDSAALATHRRIAEAACEAGFGRVVEVTPGLEAAAQAWLAQRAAGG